MAKKRSKREWWFYRYASQPKPTELVNRENKEPVFLFDSPQMAYGKACHDRIEVKTLNGERVVDPEGYAQLQDKGKIILVGIKGKYIDWKQAEVQAVPGGKGEVLFPLSAIALNKQTIYKVLEESDDMYNRYTGSPLGRAGGLTPIEETSADAETNSEIPVSEA